MRRKFFQNRESIIEDMEEFDLDVHELSQIYEIPVKKLKKYISNYSYIFASNLDMPKWHDEYVS